MVASQSCLCMFCSNANENTCRSTRAKSGRAAAQVRRIGNHTLALLHCERSITFPLTGTSASCSVHSSANPTHANKHRYTSRFLHVLLLNIQQQIFSCTHKKLNDNTIMCLPLAVRAKTHEQKNERARKNLIGCGRDAACTLHGSPVLCLQLFSVRFQTSIVNL